MLIEMDAALRRRSRPAWLAFRIVAGGLAAIGLMAWVGVWFERNFWLGVSMAVSCGLVVAHELGLLSRRSGDGGPQHDGRNSDS